MSLVIKKNTRKSHTHHSKQLPLRTRGGYNGERQNELTMSYFKLGGRFTGMRQSLPVHFSYIKYPFLLTACFKKVQVIISQSQETLGVRGISKFKIFQILERQHC